MSDMNPESDTRSLDSEVEETELIEGRLYQPWSMNRGASFLPVDEIEQDRQERLHRFFQDVFDGRLIFPSPAAENPKRVLECGFGSANWACEVAEKYPNATVIGIDVSPHLKPNYIPDNLHLQIDDLNDEFTFPNNYFDVVHSQHVITGIKKRRWPGYIGDCVSSHSSRLVLKPDGWLQFVELHLLVQSDNGTITPNHAVDTLSQSFISALENTRDLRVPTRFASMFQQAGLVEVEQRIINLPLNPWMADPRWQERGLEFREAFVNGLEGSSMIPLTRNGGMSAAEVRVLLAQSRRDLQDVSLKPYIALYVTIGRKPNS